MSALGAAAISGGSGLIGSAINAGTQKKINASNQQYAKEMREYQNQWNLDQWNRQNDYNSPAAQMSRYEDAGLNPNLIYGQQNVSSSSPSASTTSAMKQAPKVNGAAGANAIRAYQNVKMQQAQIDNIQERNELLRQQQMKEVAQTNSINQATRQAGIGFNNILGTGKKFTSNNWGLLDTQYANLANTKANTLNTKANTLNTQARTLNTNASTANIKANTSYTNAQRKRILQELSQQGIMFKNLASTGKKFTMGNYQLIDNLNERLANQKNTNKLQQYDINAKSKGYTWSDKIMDRFLRENLTDSQLKAYYGGTLIGKPLMQMLSIAAKMM